MITIYLRDYHYNLYDVFDSIYSGEVDYNISYYNMVAVYNKKDLLKFKNDPNIVMIKANDFVFVFENDGSLPIRDGEDLKKYPLDDPIYFNVKEIDSIDFVSSDEKYIDLAFAIVDGEGLEWNSPDDFNYDIIMNDFGFIGSSKFATFLGIGKYK